MSVDTLGRLKGYIDPEIVLDYIRTHYDNKAVLRRDVQNLGNIKQFDYVEEYYGTTGDWLNTTGTITFLDGNETRMLFYCYSNINSYENLKYYSEYHLEDMVKSETTSVILGKWGNSISIIKNIVSEFGGWVDEDDCDDEPYYYIEGKPHKELPTAIRKSVNLEGHTMRVDFSLNYVNADGDKLLHGEDVTVLFNTMVISIDEVHELIDTGKAQYDNRVIYTTKERADNLQGITAVKEEK